METRRGENFANQFENNRGLPSPEATFATKRFENAPRAVEIFNDLKNTTESA